MNFIGGIIYYIYPFLIVYCLPVIENTNGSELTNTKSVINIDCNRPIPVLTLTTWLGQSYNTTYS